MDQKETHQIKPTTVSTKKKNAAAPAEQPEVAPVENPEAENAPEYSAELKAALEGIFRDDPQAEAYYSEDEKTFLNALQYERLENKKEFVKYPNPK